MLEGCCRLETSPHLPYHKNLRLMWLVKYVKEHRLASLQNSLPAWLKEASWQLFSGQQVAVVQVVLSSFIFSFSLFLLSLSFCLTCSTFLFIGCFKGTNSSSVCKKGLALFSLTGFFEEEASCCFCCCCCCCCWSLAKRLRRIYNGRVNECLD